MSPFQPSDDRQPYPPKVLVVHLELLQYPTLCKSIRRRMREELFAKGIISASRFRDEVHDKAMQSQRREHVESGMDEPEHDWQERVDYAEAILTEFYYATNFATSDLMGLVEDALAAKGAPSRRVLPAFNAEIAPWSMLFAQARAYEQLPAEQQARVAHHLREIIVVLTKGMVSDQLSFIAIAKEVFTVTDLERIRKRRIGRGKIGGKAAGFMLAQKILATPEPDDPPGMLESVASPSSWFLGADVFYEFLEQNQLLEFMALKYRSYEDNVAEYPRVLTRFVQGRLPSLQREQLQALLERVGKAPLIVRSSSLLEDNFGVAFAGKYESVFCPNQGTIEQNLAELCAAIKRVYASALAPDALVYLQQRGLVDYDERMGVLIQEVQGQQVGMLHFPPVAGVGFSYSPIVWNPRLRREEGFLRIVAGLGTRAVDRVDSDYARMVALSHPTIQPTKSVAETVQYSQRQLDVINLATNAIETIDAQQLLDINMRGLGLVASLLRDDTLEELLVFGADSDGKVVLTFAGLLKNRRFIELMVGILKKLERHYGRPVDIEFTAEQSPVSPTGFRVHVVQCRQQSRRADTGVEAELPEGLAEDQVLFVSKRMVADGVVSGVRYLGYVDPEKYRNMSHDGRLELARTIGQLNAALDGEAFVLVGPGRWGSSNRELGVPVGYGDIYNAKALVEVAVAFGDNPPEASYGTHFFQDLIESNIYPLPVYPAEEGAHFDFQFFRSVDSVLLDFVADRPSTTPFLRLIDLDRVRPGQRLEIVMSSREKRAIGYLKAL